MEVRLRAAWRQVLDVEDEDNELDGDSNFFREDVDSVAAIRLIGVAEYYNINSMRPSFTVFPII